MSIKSHKDLVIWKQSMLLVEKVYNETLKFPADEKYGITSQIRKSVVSVPSNIAEGAGRRNTKEFIQFLYISQGSLAELDTQLEICQKVGYINNYFDYEKDIKSIRILISRLISSLTNKQNSK